jgi:hypothetical protein
MRSLLVVVAGVLAACGDSTDIAGMYYGNATYTRSDGTTGAGVATVIVTDAGNNNVNLAIGSGCPLAATEIQQIDIENKTGYDNFVLTSESIAPQQSCGLPDGTISIATGDLVVDYGLTMTLDLGGPITDATGSDYIVYNFSGAAQ